MADKSMDSSVAGSSAGSAKLAPFVIVAVLMLAEGFGVYFLARALSPAAAEGAASANALTPRPEATDQFAEVELAECRPSNMTTGKLVTFHIRVSALVARQDADRAEALVRRKRARLEDAVNTVIRSAEPRHLREPTLETIKRRLRGAVNQILGDESLIQEVLIPQLLQSGNGL